VIVIDASVLVNVIGDDGRDGATARAVVARAGDLSAPDLVDVETVSVLRKRWLEGALTARRFSAAVSDLEVLPLVRYRTLALMRRAYALRANLPAYDAAYVALAESIGCHLVTADRRLANAPGPRCAVELV